MSASSRILLFLALCAVAACGDTGPVAGPGTLEATLVSPNGAEGAARILLMGPGIGEISRQGANVFTRQQGDTVHVVLIHDTSGDLRFSVALADTTQRPVGVVIEVSGPDDQLRDLAGYALEFTR